MIRNLAEVSSKRPENYCLSNLKNNEIERVKKQATVVVKIANQIEHEKYHHDLEGITMNVTWTCQIFT